jgi:hypothetical protein
MRRIDIVTHLEAAITRAFIPTTQDSYHSSIRNSEVYQALNSGYHNEKKLTSYIDEHNPSKWKRVKWVFTGTPSDRNLEKLKVKIAKDHSVRHRLHKSNVANITTNDYPHEFGQVDPLYRPPPDSDSSESENDGEEEESSCKDGGEGLGMGLTREVGQAGTFTNINMAPGGTSTTLEQC